MRVLLDECIDEELRHHFAGHQCETCRYAGLRGLGNGQLLSAAEEAGFSVLVTVDQNMPYQQNLEGRLISLVVLSPTSTNVEDLIGLIPQVIEALKTLRSGEVFLAKRSHP